VIATGIGIAEEDKERVFEEFERAAGDDVLALRQKSRSCENRLTEVAQFS
jgi:hypothetical protein